VQYPPPGYSDHGPAGKLRQLAGRSYNSPIERLSAVILLSRDQSGRLHLGKPSPNHGVLHHGFSCYARGSHISPSPGSLKTQPTLFQVRDMGGPLATFLSLLVLFHIVLSTPLPAIRAGSAFSPNSVDSAGDTSGLALAQDGAVAVAGSRILSGVRALCPTALQPADLRAQDGALYEEAVTLPHLVVLRRASATSSSANLHCALTDSSTGHALTWTNATEKLTDGTPVMGCIYGEGTYCQYFMV
jgi:hypothetical protein